MRVSYTVATVEIATRRITRSTVKLISLYPTDTENTNK